MTQQELLHSLILLGGKATNRQLLEQYLKIHKSSGHYEDLKCEPTIENQYYSIRKKCLANRNIIRVDKHITTSTEEFYVQVFYYLPTHPEVSSFCEQEQVLRVY